MNADNHRRTILWVGRIHPVKQPMVFLDVAERCPEFSFTMVGMRDPLETELWDAVQERLGRMRNVAFQPNLSLSQVDERFGSAALLVNTSQYEGFPNTYVQAAVHGVPIVSLSVDPDHVIAQHSIGQCVGGGSERLVEAVRRFSMDETLRADRARRARIYALEHHSLDAAVSRWKTALMALAGQRRADAFQEAA
jgi:glycosyltransferase involved in cell wall biosynthesis